MHQPKSDSEWRLAEALAILKIHEHDAVKAQIDVAERIGALAAQGDIAGVARWQEIAKAMDEILRPKGQL